MIPWRRHNNYKRYVVVVDLHVIIIIIIDLHRASALADQALAPVPISLVYFALLVQFGRG